MMLLKKEKWADFTAALAGNGRTLWAPSRKGALTCFSPVGQDETPELTYANSTLPPKNIFFPQTETLYRFSMGEAAVQQPALDGSAVLLGVRPCDARAAAMLEKLFCWDTDDPYYLARREQVILIGLACREPGLNCFCAGAGGGPASTEGLDLLLHDLEDAYLADPLTARGNALLEEAREHFEEAPAEARRAAALAAEEAVRKLRRSVDLSGIPERLPELWEHSLWQQTAASCLGCGSCTYLCPTCHCFDIQDEAEGFQGRRYRCWDSCMFEEYSLHTSGHNPRPTRRERTRNRVNHKYAYFVEKFGVIACVGCGRCINHCPVNIDLLEILRQVKEAL